MNNYRVIIEVDEAVYEQFREFLKDAKFPVAGHQGGIGRLNRWLYVQALRQFNQLPDADKLSLMARVSGGSYLPTTGA